MHKPFVEGLVASRRTEDEKLQTEEDDKRRRTQTLEENMLELQTEVRNLTEQYKQKEESYTQSKKVPCARAVMLVLTQ